MGFQLFNNITPLHFASKKGYTSITQLLSENDADINVKTDISKTL